MGTHHLHFTKTTTTTTLNMKFIILAALAVIAVARPQYSKEPAYPDTPPQYASEYAVKDEYSGVDFGANEERNGYDTQGSYYVALPDGRLQRVHYTVQGEDGYVADVTYEGEAQYPPAAPYKPAPSYARRR